MTVVATGLSSQRRAQARTPPLSVVQPQAQQLRTGTDNLPILNQPVQAPGNGATDCTHMNTPSVWHNARSQAAAKVEALSSNGMDGIEIPAFLRKQAEDTSSCRHARPRAVRQHVARAFRHSRAWVRPAAMVGCNRHHRLRPTGGAGPVRGLCSLKAAQPGVSLNLLCTLIGAVEDRDWRDVAREDRTAILLRLKDMRLL